MKTIWKYVRKFLILKETPQEEVDRHKKIARDMAREYFD